jgi:hypothetical protein
MQADTPPVLWSGEPLVSTSGARIAVISCYFGAHEPFNPTATDLDSDQVELFVFSDHPVLPVARKVRLITLPKDPVGPAIQSRLPKLCPHLFLNGFDWVLYLDNRARLRLPPEVVIDMIRQEFPHQPPGRYLFRHSARSCIWEEVEKCRRLRMMTEEAGNRIIALLEDSGYPRDNGLYENPLMVQRMGSPETDRLNEDWYASLSTYTRRDQVLLPFLLWQSAIRYQVVQRAHAEFIDWPVISHMERRAFRKRLARHKAGPPLHPWLRKAIRWLKASRWYS